MMMPFAERSGMKILRVVAAISESFALRPKYPDAPLIEKYPLGAALPARSLTHAPEVGVEGPKKR